MFNNDKYMSYDGLDGNMPIHITSSWIWKNVSATLQSYKYTLSYPEGGGGELVFYVRMWG